MLDRPARRTLRPALEAVARPLHRAGVSPNALTGVGLAVGVAACVAAGLAAWGWALALWLANRLLDGLDGPVARLAWSEDSRRAELGGYLDIVADFLVYGAFVAGCAVGRPDARLACVVLLVSYYVNGTAFLAFSSVAERLRARGDERVGAAGDRSLNFVGGLAEGTETVVAHGLMVLVPSWMVTTAWVFAGIVAVTVVQRVVHARRVLVGTR